GTLVPVEVEGVRGKRLVLADELPLLQAPPEPAPTVAFLPPFDSLLWDTALGVLRAADPLRRPLRRPDRAADRSGARPGRGARALVGGAIRAGSRGGVRRGDARGARRVSALRRRRPARLGR